MRTMLPIVLILSTYSRSEDDLERRCRSILKETAAAWDVPAATIAVVRHDDEYFAAHGLDRAGAPVDADTLFGIGSVSKGLFATLVASYVADGTLKWNDSVARLRPAAVLGNETLPVSITVIDCLCYRTGLSGNDVAWYVDSRIDRRGLIATLAQRGPYGSLAYNHVPYVLLADAVESVTGKPWDRELAARVLEPLEMRRTFADPGMARKAVGGTNPHMVIGGQIRHVSTQSPDALAPAFGMCSCSRDLMKWARWLLGRGGTVRGRPAPAVLLRAAVAPEGSEWSSSEDAIEYGIGCSVDTYGTSAVAIFGDDGRGWSALVGVVPDKQIAVVILSNVGTSDFPWALWYRVTDAMIPGIGLEEEAATLRGTAVIDMQAQAVLEKDASEGDEVGAATQGKIEGSYVCEGLPRLVVKRERDGLMAVIGELRGRVRAVGGVFRVRWEQDHVARGTLRFNVGSDGRAVGLELLVPDWPRIQFQRE